MADYWIKLYNEILDDPKMAVLPDRLWRRIIELFLLAGKLHKDGELPETNQIAWALRMSTDDLAMDLQQIANTRIIKRTINGWIIPQFAKRQAAASDAERKQQERKRKQADQYYQNENVTNQSRNVTQITDTDTDTDTDQKQKTSSVGFNIFTLYQNTFGAMATQFVSQELADIEREYPQDWIIDAFKETALRRGKSIKYTERILTEWQRNGRKAEQTPVGIIPPPAGYTAYVPEGD